MPYIKKDARERLDGAIEQLAKLINREKRAGELNYCINRLLLLTEKDGKYTDLNELVGVLEAAKLEFYRRRLVPYEEGKISENGDMEEFPPHN